MEQCVEQCYMSDPIRPSASAITRHLRPPPKSWQAAAALIPASSITSHHITYCTIRPFVLYHNHNIPTHHLSTPKPQTEKKTKMSSILGRAAFRATRPLRASGVTSGAENAASAASREADKNALKKGARRDPELYVLLSLVLLLSHPP